MPLISTLGEILLSLLPVFTEPGSQTFLRLVVGWIVCPARRTITGIIPFADPGGKRSHDAYHRFFRAGAWCLKTLYRAWGAVLVDAFCESGPVWLIADDTVHKKTGRKVDGAKFFRDAVRSTAGRIVYVWGLQIAVVCLKVNPPWGGEPLALPINFRLWRKGGASLPDLVEEMMNEIAGWFPGRRFYLVADGLYATLAGRKMTRTHTILRMRRDAAVYKTPPPRRPGKRGRPRKKGERLPSPAEMARKGRKWKMVETTERGRKRTRLLYCRRVLWYEVCPERQVMLVISRDPKGKEKDDFFFTTDLDLAGADVVSAFADRWPIEDTFRNVKQFLGGEQPQCWKGEGPQRAASLSHLLYGIVWLWYIKHGHASDSLAAAPWYPGKSVPSFKDAIAALRKALWRERFFQTMGRGAKMDKFQKLLVDALARAA